MLRLFLLAVLNLAEAAWAAPAGLPTDADLAAEMARQRETIARRLREVDASFGAATPAQIAPRLPDPVRPAAPADPLAVAERYRQTSAQADAAPGEPDLLVFVSFSMPEASLKRLAAEAGRAGAVMVFRGPKDGSLKATLAAFEPLAKLGGKAMLHPDAYARQGVTHVPVYTLGPALAPCGEGAEACQDVLRLAGDVSLEYALERMARSGGSLAAAAESRLARMRGWAP